MSYVALAAVPMSDSDTVYDNDGNPVLDDWGAVVFTSSQILGDVLLSGVALSLVTAENAIRQKLVQRCQMFLGEWFLDLSEGVPYYRDIFIKSPSLSVIRSIFRRVLESTPGVDRVKDITLENDTARRSLAVGWEVTTDTGENLTQEPFNLGEFT